MARQPRFVIPGFPQHVIIRGNNREAIFYSDDDYNFYLEKLGSALKHYDVHLLITPWREDGISKVIQNIGRYYVQYFNLTYCRTGTLFEGRYKASLIDSNLYLLVCYRYIELNPVRANMVEHPAEYPWSSYRNNALGDFSDLVTKHFLYENLGCNDDLRQSAYRGLFDSHISKKSLDDIREATNKSWVLGGDYFKKKIAIQVSRQLEPVKRGGDRRSKDFNRV